MNLKSERHIYVWTENIHEESIYNDTYKYSSGSVEIWETIIYYNKVNLVFIEHPVKKKLKRKFQDYVNQILIKKPLNWI